MCRAQAGRLTAQVAVPPAVPGDHRASRRQPPPPHHPGRPLTLRSDPPATAGVRRALIVVCVFFIFQQISGINVPFYYGPTLLGSYFGGGTSTAVSTATAGVEVTAILGAVNVIATYFAFRWIDKVGRRPLAL
jgi:hypothetical protein